ncbi:MAG: tRNA lysidine(34) synthetase TilS [Actinomycetota bacterium]
MAAPGRVSRPLGGVGYDVVERVRDTIRRYRMLEGGETVVVGASGGPDSTCLLDILARLDSKLGLNLVVAHVDHGLSEESERIAGRVSAGGAEAGYDVHVMRIKDLEGPNLHARARDLRYSFFDTIAAKTDASRIATGHTLDDRVETTLARLIHGAGTAGLAGIPPVDLARIRPLIDLRRAEARAYCEELSLPFFDDPANVDERFERPAIRARVLDSIESHWGPGAIEAMATSADRLTEDATALKGLAERLFAEIAETTERSIRLDGDALLEMPRAFRRRILELAVGRVRDRSGGIDAALDSLDSSPARELRFAVAQGIEIVVGPNQVVVNKPD